MPVAVDLIRFEKNLLQIGFFGAHDTRHGQQSTRRIEQMVNRGGQRIKVSAEFRASQELGLPSTSDRDKYIAFMKIAMERKAKFGVIQNPIRFSGYQLLKELGLSFSGENYEDINRWGQRMADSTITSEQVMYLAARKKYVNKTVHVFRSFLRAGQDGGDSGRTETFEVVLEDWLLENLNQSFVVPEDFNAYRKLKRPTAKGIFGYLHLWFHASHGRPIEKDYAELCMLLNIPVYRHASKIRETMGRSLDELTKIRYLSEWDVRPMSSKEGFKLVLVAGSELSHVLALAQKKQLGDAAAPEAQPDAEQIAALQALADRGISTAKAQALVCQYSSIEIQDQIEYAEYLMQTGRTKRIDNPAGFIIYLIENQLAVPTGFVTSRRLRDQQDTKSHLETELTRQHDLRVRYEAYVDAEVDRIIEERFPGGHLKARIKAMCREREKTDERFQRFSAEQREDVTLQFLRREIRETLSVESFETWCESQDQLQLF